MKNILCISIASPSKSGPESLQVAKYLIELSKSYNIDLVTTKSSRYGWNKHYEDHQADLSYLNSYIELPGFNNRVYSKLKTLLPSWVRFPDSDFHFTLNSSGIIRRLKNVPDLIYSRSTPFSSAILAYKLSQELGKPWIMHMSDPWSINPELKNKKKHEKWEKKCIEKADLVSVTNHNYLNFLKDKYPSNSEKFFLSYNVFSETFTYNQPASKLVLAYFGNFYAKRNPFNFLNTVSELYKNEDNLFDNFEIRFYGNRSNEMDNKISSLGLPFVVLKDAIPAGNIPEVLNEISILLNFEDPTLIEGTIMTLPSKVIDYLAYRKPIISITSPLSPSINLIEGKYGYAFASHEQNKLRAFLKDAIVAKNESNTAFFEIAAPPNEYSNIEQVSVLSEKIEYLTKGDTE